MIGVLNDVEKEEVLQRQHIGRLGVSDGERVFVFPLAYGYDGISAYFVSHEGLKVQIMRRRPRVCFQVDEITSPSEWWSVMLFGEFEELTQEAQRDAALDAILNQVGAPSVSSMAPYVDGPEKIVIYRLRITEKTGRFERSQVIAISR